MASARVITISVATASAMARTDPSPKMQEVKYNYQPMAIEIHDGSRPSTTKNLFTNTNVYDAIVTLEKEGQFVHQQVMTIDVEPLGKKKIELTFRFRTDGEYVLTFILCIARGYPLGKERT